MGPGVAIEPTGGDTTVVAPIAGRILKILPHAFIIVAEDGLGVLVHLGINTVRLEGEGFEILATEGASVAQGDPMVRWNPDTIVGDDLSTVIPIIAVERPADSVTSDRIGETVTTGELLFAV